VLGKPGRLAHTERWGAVPGYAVSFWKECYFFFTEKLNVCRVGSSPIV
jgi:hypothetical protein